MSTQSQPATSFQEKLYKNQNGELYFTLVHCPACKMEFRLLWPASVAKYPYKAKLNLTCPGCHHGFSSRDLSVYDICHVAHGCEHYPAALVESIELPNPNGSAN